MNLVVPFRPGRLFAISIVIPFYTHPARVVIFPLQRGISRRKIERFPFQVILDPADLILVVIFLVNLVVSFRAGRLFTIPIIVAFYAHTASIVILPFQCSITRRHRKRFSIQIILNPIRLPIFTINLPDFIISLSASNRFPVPVKILFADNVTFFIILPFHRSISRCHRKRFPIQIILNPACLILLIEFLPNLVIPFPSRNQLSIRTIRPLDNRIPALVVFPLNPDIRVPQHYRLTIFIKPGFTGRMVPVQIGLIHPVILPSCTDYRLPVQTEIRLGSDETIFSIYLRIGMVSVRQQHFFTIFVKIAFPDQTAFRIVFPFHLRISGS